MTRDLEGDDFELEEVHRLKFAIPSLAGQVVSFRTIVVLVKKTSNW